MKKIFTLFAVLAMVMSMSAVNMTGGEELYLTPNSNWLQHGDGKAPRFAIYVYGSGGDSWASMTAVEGESNLYKAVVPNGNWTNVIFCRMNGGKAANDWGNRYNQTGNLTYNGTQNWYTVKEGTWDNGGGTWALYAPEAPKSYKDITITIVANATPKIHYWDGGDKMVGTVWENLPEMTATSEANTYSCTIKDVDEAIGVKYLIKVGEVQSADQQAFNDVKVNFKDLLPQVVVQGVNNWDGTDKMTVADDYLSASITLPLIAKKYDLKLTIDGAWKGHKNENNITRAKNSSVFKNDDGNGSITADIAGDYVFTYTYANQTLTVTYPALPVKYNVTVTAENGTVTGAGEYEEGKEATLTATPAEGYEFVNWTKGEEVVSTENPYKFTVTADVALVANFKLIPPTKYTVTVTANAEGENVVSGGGEYEEGKEVTVTASEDLEGWVFIGWTEDGEFVANDPEYTFDVKGDVELVAVYAMDLGQKEVTDLVIDGENMLLIGSVADFEMGTMNLELALGEYDEEEGTYLLTEESKLYVGETNFTFVDGMAAVDMNTNSAMAIVVFEHNGTYYYMTVNMSKKIEATIIEIADATVTIEERSMGFGDEVYHVLKMESTWSDGETTYPVLLETTEFDQTKESQEVAASIRVGGMGDEDPWLGSAEGDVTITVADGVVTVEGLLENAYALPAPIAFDVTISGTLPVEEPKVIAYELNGGEFPAVVVPTNEELALAFKQDYAEYFAIEGLTDTDMKREVGNFIYVTNSKGGDAVKFITENANWKWLHDYILTVAGNIPEGTNVGFYWRANLDGFFHCKNAVAVGGVASADYTEAGKPEAWGAAYQAAHAVVLPTEPVDAPYTLPTPVKEGYKFVGWYDNAEGTGEAYTVIPAGWSGTLYAIWEAEGPATALDNIAIEGKVVKTIINGQLIIIKNGVQYNAQGQVIK